jgi:hypothetical protein
MKPNAANVATAPSAMTVTAKSVILSPIMVDRFIDKSPQFFPDKETTLTRSFAIGPLYIASITRSYNPVCCTPPQFDHIGRNLARFIARAVAVLLKFDDFVLGESFGGSIWCGHCRHGAHRHRSW